MNPYRFTQEMRRIAIVMPTWIGDCCMATPTLRSIRDLYPEAEITAICRPVVESLIEKAWGNESAWVDYYLPVTKRGCDRSYSRMQLPRASRERNFDMAILLTNSFWTAAAVRLAGVPRIVGYNRDGRGWLLTDRLPVPRGCQGRLTISAVDYYLRIAEHLDGKCENKSMQLSVSDSEHTAARKLWSQVGFDNHRPTVVINSNAATDSSRLWPENSVRDLSIRVASELGLQVLIHCGPSERETANRIARLAGHSRIASMGVLEELPIGLSKAVLQRADLVVSTDSGPRHMAVALGRQVITLFGPTNPQWTTTYNVPECYLGSSDQQAMASITPDEVFSAVRGSMDSLPYARTATADRQALAQPAAKRKDVA